MRRLPLDARLEAGHQRHKTKLQRFGEIAPMREVRFAPCDLKSVEADGTFAGYASLFGAVDLGQPW